MASTACGTVAYAVISTTIIFGCRRRISRKSASPSMPAMRTSDSTTSKARCPIAVNAAGASAAVSVSCPTPRRYVAKCERIFFSSSTIRMLAISASRQLQRKATSASDRAVQQNPAAVRLHDIADERQSQAGGADLAGLRGLREALEDALALLGRNSGAGVADRHHDGAVARRCGDLDPSTGGCVAQRVRQQIGERPGQLDLVTRDDEPVLRQ